MTGASASHFVRFVDSLHCLSSLASSSLRREAGETLVSAHGEVLMP